MVETSEQFYSRSYLGLEKVFVYSYKRNIGKCEIWTIEHARQYVNYLENHERTA